MRRMVSVVMAALLLLSLTACGNADEQRYNVFYLSHGGWSNETISQRTAE